MRSFRGCLPVIQSGKSQTCEAVRCPTLCSKGNAMAKELEVNDNTVQNQERQPPQQSGDKRNQQKLQSKALQVNQNSLGDQKAARLP